MTQWSGKESAQGCIPQRLLGRPVDYHDIEWFALEMNRDHSVVFEIASKYCISEMAHSSILGLPGDSAGEESAWQSRRP